MRIHVMVGLAALGLTGCGVPPEHRAAAMATLTTPEPGQSGTSAWTAGDSGAAHPGVPVADELPATTPADQPVSSAPATSRATSSNVPATIGVRARRIWMDDDAVDRITGLDLLIGFVDTHDDLRLSGYLGGESYGLKPDSDFARQVSNPVAGIIGIEMRYEPWSEALIGPVLGGGFGAGYMMWTYTDDPTMSGGNHEGLDLLYFGQFSASAGLRLGRATGPHALLEVMPVARFYDRTTERNYEQEWLDAQGGIGLSCTFNASW